MFNILDNFDQYFIGFQLQVLLLQFDLYIFLIINRFLGEFIELSRKEQFEEMKLFMQHLELEETIFRSDHASNRLVLKGILGKDKSQFLSQIEEAIQDPYGNNIRDWGYTGY